MSNVIVKIPITGWPEVTDRWVGLPYQELYKSNEEGAGNYYYILGNNRIHNGPTLYEHIEHIEEPTRVNTTDFGITSPIVFCEIKRENKEGKWLSASRIYMPRTYRTNYTPYQNNSWTNTVDTGFGSTTTEGQPQQPDALRSSSFIGKYTGWVAPVSPTVRNYIGIPVLKTSIGIEFAILPQRELNKIRFVCKVNPETLPENETRIPIISYSTEEYPDYYHYYYNYFSKPIYINFSRTDGWTPYDTNLQTPTNPECEPIKLRRFYTGNPDDNRYKSDITVSFKEFIEPDTEWLNGENYMEIMYGGGVVWD